MMVLFYNDQLFTYKRELQENSGIGGLIHYSSGNRNNIHNWKY
jgi:hypothetical protein